MASRGAPPNPTREEKPEMSVATGAATPTPARAVFPIKGMFPTKILSTME